MTVAVREPSLRPGGRATRSCYPNRCFPVRPRVAESGRRKAGRRRASGEALLHAAWRRAARLGVPMHTRDGVAYRVLYPGRPADGG